MSVRPFAIAILLTCGATPALAQEAFGGAVPVDEDVLRGVAGRADVGSMAFADQMNEVSNNSVSGNSVTGAVQIDGNAFQNLNGLAVINANSGNNVAINAAMNVTISLSPGN
ncbi:MAG TPA: hypothetical protein VNZ43_11075 [Sphingomonadaceae bacterium]|nr:hypothetical protein [Sphingomonadaceae bacterium]